MEGGGGGKRNQPCVKCSGGRVSEHRMEAEVAFEVEVEGDCVFCVEWWSCRVEVVVESRWGCLWWGEWYSMTPDDRRYRIGSEGLIGTSQEDQQKKRMIKRIHKERERDDRREKRKISRERERVK